MATLFQAPTIAQLAHVLDQSHWTPPWQSLVAIQPSGERPPLFMVPGVGGNVLIFARLAKLLGLEQPVYGFQARGLDGTETPFTSVPAMAAHYVEQIRLLQPTGPYWVAGACTGGLIAYEIGQRLAAQGASATLFMLDTWHPDSYARYKNPLVRRVLMMGVLLGKVVSDLRALLRQPVTDWWATLTRKSHVLASVLSHSVTDQIHDRDFQVQRLTEATLVAVARYRPRRFSGRIVNIIASRRQVMDTIPDTRHRWAYLGGAESSTIHLPAEDSGRLFVSPHVEELTGQIQTFLHQPVAKPIVSLNPSTERKAS